MDSVKKKDWNNTVYETLTILLVLVGLSVYSHSSFFFAVNAWPDVNGNLTIGKCILNGIVIYRDIFEQRGPLLYLLHALAYLCGGNTYLGVFLLEAAAAVITCIAFIKILRLYERHTAICLIPAMMLVIYSSKSFGMGGSPEEFCLPMIAVSIYTVLKCFRQNEFRFRDFMVIGFMAGAVLWTKYSMLGFYFGAVLPVLVTLIRRKDTAALRNLVLGVLAGVLLISLPVLLYFALNGAVYDLFHVYFYVNMHYYPFNDTVLYRLYFAATGLLESIMENWMYWIFIVLGLIQLIRLEKCIPAVLTLFFGAMGLSITVFMGGQGFPYYGLILSVFCIFGLLVIPNLDKKHSWMPLLLSAVLIAVPFFRRAANPQTDRDSFVQYRFAKQIRPGSTLLQYRDLDAGFFLAADLLPSEYYSWSFNVLRDEIREEQNRYIAEGRIDYIVSSDPDMSEADTGNRYTLIDEDEGWYLYEKKA